MSGSIFRYPLRMEHQLLQRTREGDAQSVDRMLNELFSDNFAGEPLSPSQQQGLIWALNTTLLRLLSEAENARRRGRFLAQLENAVNAEPACAAFRRMQQMFADLAAAYEREISRRMRRVVCDIQRYVDMNYSDHELNLNSAAQRFGLQLSQLSQAFKKTVGVNFSTYLEALRIDKACEYLSAGMPVKQAAESVGYDSVYVFRKAFVRKKSMLPSDYCCRRQTMQGQEEFE